MNLTSGYPLSLIRFGLPFDYPKLQENISTEVVIMGGGISGALVSYYLTAAGVANVVVDGRSIGLGSTCASTSLLQYEIDTPLSVLQHKVGLYNAVRAYRLCDQAIDSLEQLAERTKVENFERLKSIYYAASIKDTKLIEEEFALRKKHGFAVSLIEKEDIKQQFGFNAPNAILSEQGAQTDAYTFTHALHQYSIKKGTRVYDRTCIKQIEHHKTGIRLTAENGSVIRAKKMLYATGYESVKYINKRIVDLRSTYAICSEQGNDGDLPFKNKIMMWNTADPYLYMRNTSDNRILLGGRDEKFVNAKRRDALMHNKRIALTADLKKLWPGTVLKTEFSWCGVFGSTKDGLPFIGEYPGLPNSYFALGFGGNGIVFSLIAAEILKDIITGKKNNDADIFSFDRI